MEYTLEELANDVLANHNVSFPPIDVFNIIRNEGFHLKIEKLPETKTKVSGICIEVRGEIYIFVNNESIYEHQRFTAGHELKHAIIEPGTSHIHLAGSELKRIEREANSFSANLLMPKKFIKSLKESLGFIDPYVVSRVFGVSLPAATYRLEGLKELTSDFRKKFLSMNSKKRDVLYRQRIVDLSVKKKSDIPLELTEWKVLRDLYGSAYLPGGITRCQSCFFPHIHENQNHCWMCGKEHAMFLQSTT